MKIQNDKILHFIFSYAILMSIFYATANIFIAIIATVMIGLLKEIADIWGTGFSVADLIADAIGIIAATMFIAIVNIAYLFTIF